MITATTRARRKHRRWLSVLLTSVSLFAGGSVFGQTAVNGVTAGEIWVEPSTLTSLGLEWVMTGDSNRNAKVEMAYRKAGETAWKPALSLVRQQGERVGNLEPPRADFHPDPNHYVNGNMFV